MKKTLTLITLLISVFYFSQEFVLDQVIKTDSAFTKDILYSKIKNWMVSNYSSRGNILTNDDQNSHVISAAGTFGYRTEEKYKGKACVEGPVKYQVDIYVKDGRYKYVFHSFEHKGSHGMNCRPANYGLVTNSSEAPDQGKGIQYNLGWQDLKIKIQEFVQKQVESLQKSIVTKTNGNDNW